MEVKIYQQGADREATISTVNVTPELGRHLSKKYEEVAGAYRMPLHDKDYLSRLRHYTPIVTKTMFKNKTSYKILYDLHCIRQLEIEPSRTWDKNIPEEIRESYL